MPYGIDANGNPITQDTSPAPGSSATRTNTSTANPCPQGQRWDGIQCSPINTAPNAGTQPGPPGSTPNPPPTTTPPPSKPDYSNLNGNAAGWMALVGNDQNLLAWVKSIKPGISDGDAQYYVNAIKSRPGANQQEQAGGASYWSGRILNDKPGGQETGSRSVGTQTNFSPALQFLSGTGPNTPAPQLNIQPYSPYQFTPAPAFNPGPTQGLTGNVIQQLLTSTSLSPDVVAKMKEAQKNTLLSGADQLKQQIAQSAASRGVGQGGSAAAAGANVDLKTLGDISSAYGNIDIQKAIQDQTDKLNAVGAAGGYENQLLQEWLQQAGLNLSTQSAQAGQNLAASQQNLSAEEAKFNNWLQSQGINLSYAQLVEAMRQFNMANSLNVAQFLYNS